MNRPDLGSTFTKIALWRQTQFEKIVYIDADMVALRAPDELFDQPSGFAAVPDIGWPDCFNSGLLVLSPNMGDYYSLLALAQRGISFDGADQGLLNTYFRDWHRLSFIYNCTPSGNYQYLPAYRHFQSSIKLVHYIGTDKPWRVGRDWQGAIGAYEELLGQWWAVYDKNYRARVRGLPASYTGCTNQHTGCYFDAWSCAAWVTDCTAVCARRDNHNRLWHFFYSGAFDCGRGEARGIYHFDRAATHRENGAC